MPALPIYNRKHFVRDVIIATIVVILPFIDYLYFLFPNKKTYSTAYFTFTGNYYENIQVMMWLYLLKLLFVLTYGLWFITCRHWWRSAILIPFIVFLYQFINVVDDEIINFDNQPIWITLMTMIPIFFGLIVLSKKLNYYSASKNLTEDLDNEISELISEVSNFKKTDYKAVKDQLIQIRAQKSTIDKDLYLSQLIALRDSLVKT